MCLIAYQPAGTPPLPGAVFDNGWAANSHGAGYMFVSGGKLIVRKPFFKLKELKAAYAPDHNAHGAMSAFVVHFRFATHGGRNADNVHPFIVAGDTVGIVHNGILPGFEPPLRWGMSDTAMFCNTVLSLRSADEILGDTMAAWLETWIGGNKLVFLAADGRVRIVNEKAGRWDGPYWYSNSGYRAPRSSLCKLPGVSRGMCFDSWDDWRHAAEAKGGGKGDEWDTHPWDAVAFQDEEPDGTTSFYDEQGDYLFNLDDAEYMLRDQIMERDALACMDLAIVRDGK